MKFLLLIIFISSSLTGIAADAPWIGYPSANNTIYGVYHFRRTFDLEAVPAHLAVDVSADNRYNLFVNGRRVCYGPAKGDLRTYKFDVIDIAPYLIKGRNVIAALVYNGGKDKPLAFISVQTAFMFRAEDENFGRLNSGPEWKVYKNPAYRVISYNKMIFQDRWFYGFYACGGGDDVNASEYPWGWETIGYNDDHWLKPEVLEFEGKAPWNLVPRNIPFMDNHLEYPQRIRRTTGFNYSPGEWNGEKAITIPAHTVTTVLVDFDRFTEGYPELTVSGGKNGSVKIKYAEALYDAVNLKAANRDSVNGKSMFGVWDIYRPDGQENRTFRPLWKRAFRYVQFEIETSDDPLVINSFKNEFSGYPYHDMATFESNDEKLNRVFQICQRTLRLCSGETYYDTPFYEQLNYGGDDLPIGNISVYNSSDDRLLREAMRLYSQSETRETGLMKSAYPSRFDFDMGTWGLAWIQGLHDYYFFRGDSGYVKQFIRNISDILGFYRRHLDEKTGLVGPVRNQNFVDWSITKGSIPRPDDNREISESALLSLYFAHTLDDAAELCRRLGREDLSDEWENISSGVKEAVRKTCWDPEKQLFRDYPDREVFSQHTNLLAILSDVVPEKEQPGLLNRILTYKGFDEMASSYFSFFLFRAMQKTGQEDLFLDHLQFWYQFLDRDFTSCGETGFSSHDRSDCHAWSAHPAYFLLSSVCGIKPGNIGFTRVKITPHIGKLTSVKASMPHPLGRISVSYTVKKGKLSAMIELPAGMTGTWEFEGKSIDLKEGVNNIKG